MVSAEDTRDLHRCLFEGSHDDDGERQVEREDNRMDDLQQQQQQRLQEPPVKTHHDAERTITDTIIDLEAFRLPLMQTSYVVNQQSHNHQ